MHNLCKVRYLGKLGKVAVNSETERARAHVPLADPTRGPVSSVGNTHQARSTLQPWSLTLAH